MVEFAYNNKVQTSTKVLPFKVNNKQDPFEIRKRRKFGRAKEFVKRIKKVHEETKVVLRKCCENRVTSWFDLE